MTSATAVLVFHRNTNARGGYNARSSRTITSMTRPPFAEFSSLAIRELNAWLGRHAQWSERFRDVFEEHVLPVADKAGLDPEEVFQELGRQDTRAGLNRGHRNRFMARGTAW